MSEKNQHQPDENISIDELSLTHIKEILVRDIKLRGDTEKEKQQLQEKVHRFLKMMERVKFAKYLKIHKYEFDVVDWRFDM